MQLEGIAPTRYAKPDGGPVTSFCPRCGSALFVELPAWPTWVYPFASAIDTALPVPPEFIHIQLRDRVAWTPISPTPADATFETNTEASILEWHERLGLKRRRDARSQPLRWPVSAVGRPGSQAGHEAGTEATAGRAAYLGAYRGLLAGTNAVTTISPRGSHEKTPSGLGGTRTGLPATMPAMEPPAECHPVANLGISGRASQRLHDGREGRSRCRTRPSGVAGRL